MAVSPSPPSPMPNALKQSSRQAGVKLPPASAPPLGSLEAEKGLRQFLRVARPEWSCPRKGKSNMNRAIEKLRSIGITDISSLVAGIERNSVNDQLVSHGFVPFSRDAIEGMRRQTPFIKTLERIETPYVRQVGQFASVPQMLSKKRIVRPELVGSDDCAGGLRLSSSAGTLLSGRRSSGGSHVSECSSLRRAASCSAGFFGSDDNLAFDCGGELRLRGSYTRGNSRRKRPARSFPEGLSLGASTEETGLASEGRHSRVGASSKELPSVQEQADGTCKLSGLNLAKADSGGGSTCRERLNSMTSEDSFTRRQSLRRPTVAADATVPTVAEVQSLLKIGAAMREETLEARWSPGYMKTPSQQGEEMLREQEALLSKDRFVRELNTAEMRAHIARNIRERLREEASRDMTEGLSIQTRCMSIRKHIASMTNARRELAVLRSRVAALSGEENEQVKDMLSDFASGFQSVVGKRANTIKDGEDAASDDSSRLVEEADTSREEEATSSAVATKPRKASKRKSVVIVQDR